ncbi:MAG: bifunctional rhamnulose-1-phosphate aldolase/short-chain dehydrogenase [Candidatus Manganitrophaceae bacterium]
MESLWSDRDAKGLAGVDLVVYTSRIVGANSNLVLWGGGNSSIKVDGKDHTGTPVRILWIKGSGSDMKTITAKHFTPLRLDDLLPLMKREAMTDEEMVAYQMKSVLEPGTPKPSIETLLHAFLPSPHIYHTHADAICALTDTPNSPNVVEEVYGKEVAVVDYIRPGFLLSKWVGEAYRKNPGLKAIILDKHGLITWGDTARAAYELTISMVTAAERYAAKQGRGKLILGGLKVPALSHAERHAVAAEVAPTLRGEVSREKRMVLQYEDAPSVLKFAGSEEAKRLTQIGPFTPDHLMHTKPWPLFVDTKNPGDPEKLREKIRKGCEVYREKYIAYFEKYKTAGVTMLDPNPRVVLIPGIGMFTTGKDRRATRIPHDLYLHTMSVIQAASGIDAYRSITTREICDFEYWPMENFKLTLLPPEKEFSRKIALVTGAAGGIGRAIATAFVEAGAMVVLTDIDLMKTLALVEEMNQKAGEVNATAVVMDVTDPRSVRRGFEQAVLAYGGLDIFISNAGVAKTASVDQLSLTDWEASLAVNATGHFLTSQMALRIMKEQRVGGSVVVVATKNVLAPGKDFGAYSASKAAQTQLARIMAIENAGAGIRVNMVNPDGVFENSGLWSPAIREERARAHGIPVEQVEAFYAKRNLLQTKITARDVAESVLFLASDRAAKTTGAMIPVDGGVREAFPR